MNGLQKGLLALACAGAVGFGIYEARQASHLRNRLHNLEQLQADRIQQVQNERDAATNRLTLLSSETERLKSESADVLKLRSEVTRLGNQQAEVVRLRQENQQLRSAAAASRPAAPPPAAADPNYLARDSWAFAGYATPEAALQTIAWAASHGDLTNFLASVTPEQQTRFQNQWQGRSGTEIAAQLVDETNGGKDGNVAGFRIVKKEMLSDNDIVFTLALEGRDTRQQTVQMEVQRVGTEWRVAGPYRPVQ